MSAKFNLFQFHTRLFGLLVLLLTSSAVIAHGVASGDQGFIEQTSGSNIIPFIYLGAKHMVTGYDHLLFLFAVIFFLYKLSHIAIYVSLFALGHSITLLAGVYFNIPANAYLIDAIIGLSVVYKALNNMGAYQRWFGVQPNTKIATFIFGLFHGFGLATKMQDFELSSDGLLSNLIAFNVGVEFGQLLALAVILIIINYFRRLSAFYYYAYSMNVFIMTGGLTLMGFHTAGYLLTSQ